MRFFAGRTARKIRKDHPVSLNERIRNGARTRVRAKISALAFVTLATLFFGAGVAYAFTGRLNAGVTSATPPVGKLPTDSAIVIGQDLETTATPEPGTLGLFGTGIVGMIVMVRRKKSKNATTLP